MRRLLTSLVVLCGLLALLAPASARAFDRPSPGAAGLGDRLYPTLGNGGYDVRHYDLDLRYATSAPTQGLDGTVTILAVATQSLSRFDLDRAGDSVGSITVNGLSAAFRPDGEDLVITPRLPLLKGLPFVVQVRHFTAHPSEPDPTTLLSTPFIATPDGSVTAGQPNATHDFLPSNDHPRDKATFTIRFDVPAGELAIANGERVAKYTANGRTHYAYVMAHPMATELLQLAVGSFQEIDRGRHDGVHVRDAVSPTLASLLADKLPTELGHLDWLQDRIGVRYPFEQYGSLVVNAEFGFALETQTLSLFDRLWFDGSFGGRGIWEPAMVHELSHHWFGDSVSPYSWDDVWLNEGHATWYEWSFAAEHGELAEDIGIPDFTDTMHAVYGISDQLRADHGPVGRPLSGDPLDVFSVQAYWGGALVLYALSQKIGYPAFQQLEREWMTRYRDGVASTQDFIALASRVSHQDLTSFLNDWVYGTKTPPMPGHPDWTVDPVQTGAAARALVAPALLSRFRPI